MESSPEKTKGKEDEGRNADSNVCLDGELLRISCSVVASDSLQRVRYIDSAYYSW